MYGIASVGLRARAKPGVGVARLFWRGPRGTVSACANRGFHSYVRAAPPRITRATRRRGTFAGKTNRQFCVAFLLLLLLFEASFYVSRSRIYGFGRSCERTIAAFVGQTPPQAAGYRTASQVVEEQMQQP